MPSPKKKQPGRARRPAPRRRPRSAAAALRAAAGADSSASSAPAAGPAPGGTRLYVLSDSTGNLARHMLTAFLTQFPRGTFEPVFLPFIDTPAALARALDQVAAAPGAVMHALVSPADKVRVTDACAAHGLPCCDLTGGFVAFLAAAAGVRPAADVARLHRVDEEYTRRIGAIDFTLEHDDGLGLDTLGEADIVLVGISRTGKTPTSIYLAQQGYRVANVSLAKGIPPPPEVDALPPRRAIGLVIDPIRLAEIRTARQASWHMPTTDYNRQDSVEEEVAWSRRQFRDRGWPVLDVTHSAVEETAARIVELLGPRVKPA